MSRVTSFDTSVQEIGRYEHRGLFLIRFRGTCSLITFGHVSTILARAIDMVTCNESCIYSSIRCRRLTQPERTRAKSAALEAGKTEHWKFFVNTPPSPHLYSPCLTP